MKKNNIIKGVAGMLVAGALASCSSDYLEIKPIASVTDQAVAQNTTQGQYAVNGIVRNFSYYRNVSGDGSGAGYPGGTCGEAYMMTMFGDMYNQDYYSGHMGIFQYGQMMKMQMLSNSRWYNNLFAWGFYYGIIGQANRVLDVVDQMQEEEHGAKKLIEAECKVFRAHCYVRLLQIFGPRWSDSAEGANKCIVIRTTATTDPTPLRSMNDVLELIYNDCDDAILNFNDEDVAALGRPNEGTPDLGVAYGVKARAALLKDDWQTAYDCAKLAQVGHGIMTADQWCGGFMEASNSNDDYMWTYSTDQNDIQINLSWGAYNACNGNYQNYWKYGPACINIDLIRELDPKDIRATRFLIPQNIKGVNEALWYDTANIDLTTMKFKDIMGSNRMKNNCRLYTLSCTPKAPSYASQVVDAFSDIKGGSVYYLNFGGHMKFYVAGGSDQLNQYPYMRATEMLLTQAEAAYELGLTTEAQELVAKLVKVRVEGYTTCDLTGTELRDFIRLQRRIELWGEGVGFFDRKRWRINNVRRGWVMNDPTSGNVPGDHAMDIRPEEAHHWIFALPYVEYDYNSAIDMSDLDWIDKLPK